MLRNIYKINTTSGFLTHCHRHQSTGSKSGKGGIGRPVVVGVITTFAAAGAVTAYAKHDSKFRAKVEHAIPFSGKVFSTMIGPSRDVNFHSTTSPTTKKVKEATPSLLTKTMERESPSSVGGDKRSPDQDASSKSILAPVPAPVLEEVAKENKVKDSSSHIPSKIIQSTDTGQSKQTRETSSPVNTKSGLSPDHGKDQDVQPVVTKDLAKISPSVDFNQSTTSDVEEKHRLEMIEQLKLQLSAYNDYLREQLQLQQDELQRLHLVALEEKALEEKKKYQRELASSIARLQEVENVLNVRRRLDREEKILKQLWFLCQHLNDCLKSNPSEGIESNPRKLVTQEILPVLEKITKDEDAGSLVHLAVQSIQGNQELKERGVYTEDALICRFDQVDKVCRRVSLVGDEGASLWRYMLSFLQSMMIFDITRIPSQEFQDVPVDTEQLDTFQVLSRVRHHLKNRNLEMSLRYANQLRGKPRQAALDWIRDVRTHLEVKQAVSLIQTHASCVSLKTFNTRS